MEKTGRKSKKINFNFVCVKKDFQYFEALIYNSNNITPNNIKHFINNDLGLVNLLNSANAEFKDVNFYAVSAISSNTVALKQLFFDLLKQQGVKI